MVKFCIRLHFKAYNHSSPKHRYFAPPNVPDLAILLALQLSSEQNIIQIPSSRTFVQQFIAQRTYHGRQLIQKYKRMGSSLTKSNVMQSQNTSQIHFDCPKLLSSQCVQDTTLELTLNSYQVRDFASLCVGPRLVGTVSSRALLSDSRLS